MPDLTRKELRKWRRTEERGLLRFYLRNFLYFGLAGIAVGLLLVLKWYSTTSFYFSNHPALQRLVDNIGWESFVITVCVLSIGALMGGIYTIFVWVRYKSNYG